MAGLELVGDEVDAMSGCEVAWRSPQRVRSCAHHGPVLVRMLGMMTRGIRIHSHVNL